MQHVNGLYGRLLAATMLAPFTPPGVAAAQSAPAATPQPADASSSSAIGEIVVTAQKREENIQKVPISLQALSPAVLDEHQVKALADFVNLLPSVSFTSQGPGRTEVYFRGISSGSNGPGGSGLLPTAGFYLDDLPVQTAGRSLDVHIYDIARVEALSGPQGTLFGASSLSGTLRVITNKPDPKAFSAGIDVQANQFGHGGGSGGSVEGFLNLPLARNVALRAVGYWVRDGGYISNVPATLTFNRGRADQSQWLTINDYPLAGKNVNTTQTYGGRLELGIELDNGWTISPTLAGQHQDAKGSFLYDPKVGDLEVTDFTPNDNIDQWYQAALAIKGHIGNFDLVYSGGYLDRKATMHADYTYYTQYYDSHQSNYTPTIFTNPTTSQYINPAQNLLGINTYTKQTHELRISSPPHEPLRATVGVFYQRQINHTNWQFIVAGAGNSEVTFPSGTVPGSQAFVFGDTFFDVNTRQTLLDEAAFGEVAYDITRSLTLTGGLRAFRAGSTDAGFVGIWISALSQGCTLPINSSNPCNYLGQHYSQNGETHKVNLSWQIAPTKLVYATYSTGFRPGGDNLIVGVNPYKADTVNNFEVGIKSTWFNTLRFNAAAYYEQWKNVQFKLLSPQNFGISAYYNAAGARVYGLEADLTWRYHGLTLSTSGAYNDAKLSQDVCNLDASLNILTSCDASLLVAPKGTALPDQPRLKGSATARYDTPIGNVDAFVQAVVHHQSGTRSLIPSALDALIGDTAGFSSFDFTFGGRRDKTTFEFFISNAFDSRGELSRNTFCAIAICSGSARIYPIEPQRFGVKFGQRF